MSAAGDMQVMIFGLGDAITGNRDGELISGNFHSIGNLQSYDRFGNRERDSRRLCSRLGSRFRLKRCNLRHHRSSYTFFFLAQFCAIFYGSIMCTGFGGRITGWIEHMHIYG